MVGFTFVASVEPTASSEPGHGAYDGPAVAAKSLRRLDPFACDALLDAALTQPLPQVVVVVALVGVELGGLAPPRAAARPDRRYALHERDQGLAVVDVGAGDSDRQGQTGPLGDQMDLRPVLAPVDRVSDPSGPLFQSPHAHRVDRTPGPVQVTARAEFVEDQAVQLGPHPGFRPLGEPAVSRSPRRTERCGGNLLPRASRCRHEHDRGQHLTVTVTAPTATLRPRRHLRHHSLKQLLPHQTLNNPHHVQQRTEPIEMTSYAPSSRDPCVPSASAGPHVVPLVRHADHGRCEPGIAVRRVLEGDLGTRAAGSPHGRTDRNRRSVGSQPKPRGVRLLRRRLLMSTAPTPAWGPPEEEHPPSTDVRKRSGAIVKSCGWCLLGLTRLSRLRRGGLPRARPGRGG
ncbi:hypothetical protein SSPNP10_24940 [Streptomyces sp. NP10]|nr:hypothetical protein SSPNP10_24940 [Streptomyces sp. NP10]